MPQHQNPTPARPLPRRIPTKTSAPPPCNTSAKSAATAPGGNCSSARIGIICLSLMAACQIWRPEMSTLMRIQAIHILVHKINAEFRDLDISETAILDIVNKA